MLRPRPAPACAVACTHPLLPRPAPPCAQPTSWLNEVVGLPGGYSASRRDVLKLGSLAMGLGSLYVIGTRAQVCLLGPDGCGRGSFMWAWAWKREAGWELRDAGAWD